MKGFFHILFLSLFWCTSLWAQASIMGLGVDDVSASEVLNIIAKNAVEKHLIKHKAVEPDEIAQLSASDFYKIFLRYTPALHRSQKYFNFLENVPESREASIEVLRSSKALKKASAEGLRFRNRLRDQMDDDFEIGSRDYDLITSPYSTLAKLLDDFIKSQEDLAEKKRSPQLAAQLALQETVEDYGKQIMVRKLEAGGNTSLEISEKDISTYFPNAYRFYQKKRAWYEEEEVRRKTTLKNIPPELLEIWKQSVIQMIQELQVRNLQLALKELEGQKGVNLYLRQKAKPYSWDWFVNLGTAVKKVKPGELADLDWTHIQSENTTPIKISTNSKSFLSGFVSKIMNLIKNIPTFFHRGKVSKGQRKLGVKVTKEDEEGKVSQNLPDSILLEGPVDSELFQQIESYAELHGNSPEISINSLFIFLAKRFPKIKNANEFDRNFNKRGYLLHLDINNQLESLEELLSFESSPNALALSQNLKKGKDYLNGIYVPQLRSLSLSTLSLIQETGFEQKADLITGLEWYGYRHSPDFWKDRDELVLDESKGKAPSIKKKRIRRWVQDRYRKLHHWQRATIIAGTLYLSTIAAQFVPGFIQSLQEIFRDPPALEMQDIGEAWNKNLSEKLKATPVFSVELEEGATKPSYLDLPTPKDARYSPNLLEYDLLSKSRTVRVLKVTSDRNMAFHANKDGIIPLPSFENYELVYLNIYESVGKTLTLQPAGKNVRVLQHKPTGLMMVQITDEDFLKKSSNLGYKAGYAPKKETITLRFKQKDSSEIIDFHEVPYRVGRNGKELTVIPMFGSYELERIKELTVIPIIGLSELNRLKERLSHLLSPQSLEDLNRLITTAKNWTGVISNPGPYQIDYDDGIQELLEASDIIDVTDYPEPIPFIKIKNVPVVVRKLKEAGMLELAEKLKRSSDDRKSMGEEDFSPMLIDEVFPETGLYTYRNAISWGDSSADNPLLPFNRFLRDGVLFYQCDGANQFMRCLLKELYPDEPNIVVENRSGFMIGGSWDPVGEWAGGLDYRRGGRFIITGYEQIVTIGQAHLHTVLRNKDGTIRLHFDGTPNAIDPENPKGLEIKWFIFPDFLGDWGEGIASGTKKIFSQIVLPDLPDLPFDPAEIPEPLPAILPKKETVEEILGVERDEKEVPIDSPSIREKKLQKLSELQNQLLNNPFLKAAGRRRNNSIIANDTLPPQTIYQLSLAIEDYVKGKIKFEELEEKMRRLYLPVKWEEDSDLKTILGQIYEFEKTRWEQSNEMIRRGELKKYKVLLNPSLQDSSLRLLKYISVTNWSAPVDFCNSALNRLAETDKI